MRDKPSSEYLRSILHYDQDTGMLVWKYSPDQTSQWNGKYAGRYAGTLGQNGYVKVGINGKVYGAHRLIWTMVTGRWPSNQVRHLNHDGYDNRWSNLYCFEKGYTIGGLSED